MKKRIAWMTLCAFMMSLCLFGCGGNGGNKVSKDAVATVNGVEISQAALDANYNYYANLYMDYGYDMTEPEIKKELRASIMDSLIYSELFRQEAEKRGITVSDEEMEATLQDVLDNYYGGDKAALEEELGMSVDTYKEYFMKESLLEQKLTMDMVNNPEVVDVIKARHILVDTEEEAKDIIAQLDNGADFAELAKQYSTDTGSAVDGGELGYFAVNGVTTSKMVANFTAGAKALAVGDYSKVPVASEYGYHIILVEDKQDNVNLLENAEKYQNILAGIYQNGMNNLLYSLYGTADIKILIDEDSVPEYPAAKSEEAGK